MSNVPWYRRIRLLTAWSALAAVALAGCTVQTAVPESASSAPAPASSAAASASGSATQLAPAPTPATTANEGRPLAVFIGDSYTAGRGASSKAKRWTNLVAATLGWRQVNLGKGGTGYAKSLSRSICTRDCERYEETIEQAQGLDPDYVVIAGGQNDFSLYAADPTTIGSLIAATYRTARSVFPDATIIAVGPTSPVALTPATRRFNESVRAAAAEVGARYIDLMSPNVIDPRYVDSDHVHVTDAGHAAIARRVEAALR